MKNAINGHPQNFPASSCTQSAVVTKILSQSYLIKLSAVLDTVNHQIKFPNSLKWAVALHGAHILAMSLAPARQAPENAQPGPVFVF